MNEILFNKSIHLALDMNSLSIHKREEIIKLLKNMEEELLAKVVNNDLTKFQQARITQQLTESQAIIKNYYAQLEKGAIETSKDVANITAESHAEALTASVGGQLSIAIPSTAVMETLASDIVIQGATQSAYWAKQSADTAFKFSSAVRQGIVAGESLGQISTRVRNELDISRRNATVLSHTSIMTVMNAASNKVSQDNADIIKGREYLATLDSKTCVVCGSLDGKQWKLNGVGMGNNKTTMPRPPMHFSCRCHMIDVLKPWSELGIDLSSLPPAKRASMDGVVEKQDFKTWLAKQSPDRIEKVLGVHRAKLFQEGKLTIDQLLNGGKPLPVEVLKVTKTPVENIVPKAHDAVKQTNVLSSIITNGKYSAESLNNVLREVPDADVQIGKLSQFMEKNNIKTIFSSPTELSAKNKAANDFAKKIDDEVQTGHSSPVALFTTRSSRVNGFCYEKYDFVVVKAAVTTSTQGITGKMLQDVARDVIRNPDKKYRPWSFSEQAKLNLGENARPIVTMLHEIGHLVRFKGGKTRIPITQESVSFTEYGSKTMDEAHAEFFVAWLLDYKTLVEKRPVIAQYFDELIERGIK